MVLPFPVHFQATMIPLFDIMHSISISFSFFFVFLLCFLLFSPLLSPLPLFVSPGFFSPFFHPSIFILLTLSILYFFTYSISLMWRSLTRWVARHCGTQSLQGVKNVLTFYDITTVMTWEQWSLKEETFHFEATAQELVGLIYGHMPSGFFNFWQNPY